MNEVVAVKSSDAALAVVRTQFAKAEGRFGKGDFIYLKKVDQYQCPAGERAIYQFRICFRWTGSDAEDVEIVDYL